MDVSLYDFFFMTNVTDKKEIKTHKTLKSNAFYINIDKTKQCANFRHTLLLTKRQTDKQIKKTRQGVNT